MGKHEKHRVLLTLDGLQKNVKNAILTYRQQTLGFRGIDKKITKKLFYVANVLFIIGQWHHFIAYNFKSRKL